VLQSSCAGQVEVCCILVIALVADFRHPAFEQRIHQVDLPTLGSP
jgi:hypothetical protein